MTAKEDRAAELAEKVERAHAEIARLCDGGRWRMTVPVDPERDSDVILTEALDALSAAHSAPVVSAADFDALLPVLAIAGEQAEPVVVRDASEFRIWTLTEDEDGDWWGWSWREEDEEWAPVRADFLRYPVTILHAPLAADTPAADDEGGQGR